jgi:cation diffusion facilitator family transporter
VAHEGSRTAIFAAMGANLGIAVTKFVAFLLSGASSMLAEAVHSVVDTGNQVLLLVGGKRAERAPDAEHPFGYGRVRYLYGFVVSIVLFSLGGCFALFEAYEKFHDPEPIESWRWLPVAVLLVSIVLEGLSLRTALKESAEGRRGRSVAAYIRSAKSPELPVVLLEDTAALTGLAFALLGVVLTLVTGSGYWDAAGTAAIGLLLIAVAAVLGLEMVSLLVGEAASPEAVRAVREALPGEGVEGVIHLRTLHLGPEDLLVAAKIAVPGSESAADVARAIDAAERRVRAAVPEARLIYLEPDLDRSAVRG